MIDHASKLLADVLRDTGKDESSIEGILSGQAPVIKEMVPLETIGREYGFADNAVRYASHLLAHFGFESSRQGRTPSTTKSNFESLKKKVSCKYHVFDIVLPKVFYETFPTMRSTKTSRFDRVRLILERIYDFKNETMPEEYRLIPLSLDYKFLVPDPVAQLIVDHKNVPSIMKAYAAAISRG